MYNFYLSLSILDIKYYLSMDIKYYLSMDIKYYLSRGRIEPWMLLEKGEESTSKRIDQLEVYLLNLQG